MKHYCHGALLTCLRQKARACYCSLGRDFFLILMILQEHELSSDEGDIN